MKLVQGTKVDITTLEYKVIERQPEYGVVKDGYIIKLANGRVLKHQYGVSGRGKVWVGKGVTRLPLTVGLEVARAYVPNPNGYKYIKFLDGDTRNADYRNLAWASSTWDRDDDYEHPTGISVYITDIATNETVRYGSIIAAAKGVNSSHGTLISRAARSKTYPLHGRYIIQVDPEDLRTTTASDSLGLVVYSYDMATREVCEYPTHSYMSYVLGIPVVMGGDVDHVIYAGYVLARERDVAVAVGAKYSGVDPAEVLRKREKHYASDAISHCKEYLVYNYDTDTTYHVPKLRLVPELLRELVGVDMSLSLLKSRVRKASVKHKVSLAAGFGVVGVPKFNKPPGWKSVTMDEVTASRAKDLSKHRVK